MDIKKLRLISPVATLSVIITLNGCDLLESDGQKEVVKTELISDNNQISAPTEYEQKKRNRSKKVDKLNEIINKFVESSPETKKIYEDYVKANQKIDEGVEDNPDEVEDNPDEVEDNSDEVEDNSTELYHEENIAIEKWYKTLEKLKETSAEYREALEAVKNMHKD